MSEKTPELSVWLKQGKDKVTCAKERIKDEKEAEDIARVLNDGLQEKAKASGFHYVVEVET
jgi:hypothetical protein